MQRACFGNWQRRQGPSGRGDSAARQRVTRHVTGGGCMIRLRARWQVLVLRTVGSGGLYFLLLSVSRAQCSRMHDQRRDKRRRRGSAKLEVAAALCHRLRKAGAARASGGRPGRRGRIGAGTGYRAVPAQCHWTARGNGWSECCAVGMFGALLEVARATTAFSGSWLRKSEGLRLRGERSASNNQPESPAEQAW